MEAGRYPRSWHVRTWTVLGRATKDSGGFETAMSIRFLAILIFCLLPLAVWLWDYFLSAAPFLSSNGGRANRTCCSNGHESNQTAQPHKAGKCAPEYRGLTHRALAAGNSNLAGSGVDSAVSGREGKQLGRWPSVLTNGDALESNSRPTRHSISANVGRGR